MYDLCRQKIDSQVLFNNSIVNLKKEKLISIEHVCEHPQSKTCMMRRAEAQKNNEFEIELVTAKSLKITKNS